MSGPWAAIKDRILNHTPQGLFARSVLEDKPGLNGQAQPSASPLDFLPYTEAAAAVPALAKVGADGAGAASSPWAAAAAALGAGAYGAKKYLTDKGGQPVAEQKPKDANQGEPDPVANDDGTGFPAALSFLRPYLHR